MITFISSAKPEGNPESDLNQGIALATWLGSADCIYYLSKAQDGLRHPKVTFIEVGEYPEIFKLAHLASKCEGWVAILNADVLVMPLAKVVDQLERKRMKAATSYRWQGDPPAVIDPGLDFFMALPEVWADFAEKVPHDLRIGAQLWDTWALSYFATFQTEFYADITPAKVVFHPSHGGRAYGPTPETPKLWSFPVMSPCRIS